MFKRVQRFSIRKLTIGAASVLIGIAFVGIDTNSVHAATTPASSEVKQNSSQPKSESTSSAKTSASELAAQSSKEEASTKTDSKQTNEDNSTVETNDKGTSKASAPCFCWAKKY